MGLSWDANENGTERQSLFYTLYDEGGSTHAILWNSYINATLGLQIEEYLKNAPQVFNAGKDGYNDGWWIFENQTTTQQKTLPGKGYGGSAIPHFLSGGTYAFVIKRRNSSRWELMELKRLNALATIHGTYTKDGGSYKCEIKSNSAVSLQYPKSWYGKVFINSTREPNREPENSFSADVATLTSPTASAKFTTSIGPESLKVGVAMTPSGVGTKFVNPMKITWTETDESAPPPPDLPEPSNPTSAKSFNVRTTKNNGDGMTTVGDGSYEEGSIARLNVQGTENECEEWAGWSISDGFSAFGKSSYLVVDEDKTATANWVKKQKELQISVYPDGAGLTNLSALPAVHFYDCNAVVALAAEPVDGYDFVQWVDETGGLLSTSPVAAIQMNKPVKQAIAQFKPKECEIVFTKVGTGQGRIILKDKSKEPNQEIIIRMDGNKFVPESVKVAYNTPISITAEAFDGSQFFIWEGVQNRTDVITNIGLGTLTTKYGSHQYENAIRRPRTEYTAFFFIMNDETPRVQYSFKVNCPDPNLPLSEPKDCEV